ncbi:MAG TPA: M67 family metallopeptidase [Terriglobia bacterium]|nr:M67 family metallopeptidase [Terriglobia bacterium]
MIRIPESLLRQIYSHAEGSYPNESCGLLVGTTDKDTNHTVHAFRPCKNLNEERARDRYLMDPLDHLRVTREFENSPWDIIGIYHSHPDHPSRASQTDTERAMEIMATVWSYLIVSVQKGKVASSQSWVLNESEKKFYEEPLVTASQEGDSK